MFSAIIFDCDGVLINSESIMRNYYRGRLADLGLHYDPDTYSQRFKGKAWPQFVATIEQEYLKAFGEPLPDDAIDGIKGGTWEAYKRSLRASDGVEPLLAGLKLPKAVASNSQAESLDRKLRFTGLYKYFAPHLVSLNDVENGKPAPDMFLFAADRLCAAPGECLVIEDSVTGVTAAAAAGITAWGYVGEAEGDAYLPDALRAAGASEIFSHHDEIAAKLL